MKKSNTPLPWKNFEMHTEIKKELKLIGLIKLELSKKTQFAFSKDISWLI